MCLHAAHALPAIRTAHLFGEIMNEAEKERILQANAAMNRMSSICYLNDVRLSLISAVLRIILFDEKRAKRLANLEHKINLIYRDLLENESIAVCSND